MAFSSITVLEWATVRKEQQQQHVVIAQNGDVGADKAHLQYET